MFEQIQREERRDVVVTSTEAAADFVAATLAAHGIRATATFTDHAYPSLDWVHGYRVSVSVADAKQARDLLGALSDRDDVAELPRDTDADE